MTTNRTSQAVEGMTVSWPDGFPMPTNWPAIAAKYQRMEKALQYYLSWKNGNSRRTHFGHIAADALSFDPLADAYVPVTRNGMAELVRELPND